MPTYGKPKPGMNHLYYGDNLQVLKDFIPDESVDLVYLDPPFNSNRSYNVIFKETAQEEKVAAAQIQAFDDTWIWTPQTEIEYQEAVNGGVPNAVAEALVAFHTLLGPNDALAYLTMMAPRLVELHRVLKPGGSLFLHCDPTASHYLKILLDTVFSPQNFINEIIWHHGLGAFRAKNKFPSKHDVIFFYRKTGKDFIWTQLRGAITPAMNAKYSHEDEKGRYMLSYGKKYYLKGGKPIDDVWGIPAIAPTSGERLGYPTQKPILLLERILEAASDEDSVVLDPFCGCGTTIDAAQRLNRQWIGIDITYIAIDLVEKRLIHTFGDEVKSGYEVLGIPQDVEGAQKLFENSHFDFERWAVSLVNGQPKDAPGGDQGVDGVIRFYLQDNKFGKVLVSVKGGKTVNPSMMRDLGGTVDAQKADMGLLITLAEPTKGVIEAANKGGNFKWEVNGQMFPRLQVITIKELLDGAKPNLPTTMLPYIQANKLKPTSQQDTMF